MQAHAELALGSCWPRRILFVDPHVKCKTKDVMLSLLAS